MSNRYNIKNALKQDLLGITTGNNYNLTIQKVVKKYVDISEVDKEDMPFICMVGGVSSYLYGETTPVVTFPLTLVCYFKLGDQVDDDDDLLEQYFDKFLDDLMTLLGTDTTNVEQYIRSLTVSDSLPDPFHEDGMGACWVTLNIEYVQL